MLKALEISIAQRVGLSADEIRKMSPTQYRAYLENKNGRSLRFVSEFPTIGRGNVLRDHLIDGETLNNDIDRILSR